MTTTIRAIIGLFATVNAVFWIILYKRSNKKANVIHVHMVKTAVTNSKTLDEKIIDYIGANYNNPNLSLNDLQKEFSKGKKGLSALIKSRTKKSFPQLLNYLRIEESKRLITNHKFQTVSEVGFAVGFNSLTNFIRVFKAHEGTSPKNYLENQRSSGAK